MPLIIGSPREHIQGSLNGSRERNHLRLQISISFPVVCAPFPEHTFLKFPTLSMSLEEKAEAHKELVAY